MTDRAPIDAQAAQVLMHTVISISAHNTIPYTVHTNQVELGVLSNIHYSYTMKHKP